MRDFHVVLKLIVCVLNERFRTAPEFETFFVKAVAQGDAVDATFLRAVEREAHLAVGVEVRLYHRLSACERTSVLGLNRHEIAFGSSRIAHDNIR